MRPPVLLPPRHVPRIDALETIYCVLVTTLVFQTGILMFKPWSDFYPRSLIVEEKGLPLHININMNGKTFASARIRALKPWVSQIPCQFDNTPLDKSARPRAGNTINQNDQNLTRNHMTIPASTQNSKLKTIRGQELNTTAARISEGVWSISRFTTNASPGEFITGT